MASPSTPASPQTFASRIGLTVCGGGAGWLATLAFAHKPSTTALAAVAAGVALAVNAGASICKALPEIIRALSDRNTARIMATAEAEILVMRARARIEFARAGLEPDKFVQAAEMLRLLSIDPDMSPDGRRLNDHDLARLLAAPRSRSISTKPRSGPGRPGGGPGRPGKGDGGNVIPIRPNPLYAI